MYTFTQKYIPHYKALLSLGIPIIVGQIGNIILGFADTIMVGRHSTMELAAASFVNTMFMLFVIFSMGFSYGLTPIIGNMRGRDEKDGIGTMLRSGIVANFTLSVLITAILLLLYSCIHLLGQPDELIPLMRPYLLVNIVSMPFICIFNCFKQFYDAIGDTKTSMYILLTSNAINIAGNYVLIYGMLGMPEMGLLGAGVATLISRVFMTAAAMVIFMSLKKYDVYFKPFLRSRTTRDTFIHVNSMGWPVALQMGMETAAFSLTAVMVGWIGTNALAAHQIMLTISQVFYMIYYGMAAAVAVRVSFYHGQRDLTSVTTTSSAGFHLIIFIAVMAAVPIILLREHISMLFTESDDVCSLVSMTIIPLIVYQFGDGLQCTYANALRGLSHVKPMMYISFFSYFIISLPLSWFLGIWSGYGLVGIWSAFPVCLTCAGLLYFICFRRRLKEERQS